MKKIIAILSTLTFLIYAGLSFADSDSKEVTLTVDVDEYAEWSIPNQLSLGDITSIGQVLTGNLEITLYHNKDVIVGYSVVPGSPITLTCQTPGSSDTLKTEYKPSEAVGWVLSDDFTPFGYIWAGNVSHTLGVGKTTWDFWARATAASDRANDAGDYTAYMLVSATWSDPTP